MCSCVFQPSRLLLNQSNFSAFQNNPPHHHHTHTETHTHTHTHRLKYEDTVVNLPKIVWIICSVVLEDSFATHVPFPQLIVRVAFVACAGEEGEEEETIQCFFFCEEKHDTKGQQQTEACVKRHQFINSAPSAVPCLPHCELFVFFYNIL